MSSPGYVETLTDNRGLRLLWAGTVVSFLGDWLTTVAVLTIVSELSDSSLAVSAVLIAKTLPIFLISPVAGTLADRMDRRTIMLASDFGRAAMVVVMLGCWWARSLPAFLVVLTLRTLIAGFFIPARTASVPDLATPAQLPVAVALLGGTWSVMLAIGAALGGVLTQYVGITGALVLDALTFLVSAALLWGLPPLLPTTSTDGAKATFFDGLRFLRGQVYLPALLCLKATLSISGGVLVLLPIYAGGMYAGFVGPLFLGLLYAARGLGALAGSMGVRVLIGDSPRTMQWAILPAFAVIMVSYFGMALAPTFWLAALCFGCATIGSGLIWTFSGTLGQLATRREHRGRLFAMEFALTMLASSAFSLAVGAAVDGGLDPRVAVAGCGATAIVPALLWAAVLLGSSDVVREALPG